MTPAAPITPLPLPARVRTLVIYGGTFDPPHVHHAVEPRLAADRLFGRSACVVYIPAARNPLKAFGPRAGDEDRVNLLRLALGEHAATAETPPAGAQRLAQAIIWTDEIDRAAHTLARGETHAPSYTIHTLRRLRRAIAGPRPVAEGPALRLLIGADQVAGFHRWKSFRAVLRLAEPVVMLREPLATPDALYRALEASGAWTHAERAAWCTRLAPVAPHDVSSTAIRAALARRRHTRGEATLRTLLAPSVLDYIRRKGLYRES